MNTKLIVLLSITMLEVLWLKLQAQVPQQISYQAVARNTAGTVLPNQTVKLRFSVRNASSNGTIVYQETQTATTSNIGLFNVNIGEGTVSTGTFAGIDWANGAKFMQVELDPQGGNTFIDMGTQQMLSVPYAHSAGNGIRRVSAKGDSLILNNDSVIMIPGLSLFNYENCSFVNIHNPNLSYGSLTDQQGNVYSTIVIGTREWMAENLRTTIYRNGDPIPNFFNSQLSGGFSENTGYWSYYKNNSQYECPFGLLYNYGAISGPRQICPQGWHVSTLEEWNLLKYEIQGGYNLYKLMSSAPQYWGDQINYIYTSPPTNETGFSALPSGSYMNGVWDSIFIAPNTPIPPNASYWATYLNAQPAGLCDLAGIRNQSIIDNEYYIWDVCSEGSDLLSIRCVKD